MMMKIFGDDSVGIGYVTRKFLIQVEIHPGLNSTLPMVKALFVVAC